MREDVYEVFARKAREEPLTHIGFVNGMDPALARISACTAYDEQKWFEMFIVARDAMIPVKAEGDPSIVVLSEPISALIHGAGTGSYGGDDIATESALRE